jgi:hypothetical protein
MTDTTDSTGQIGILDGGSNDVGFVEVGVRGRQVRDSFKRNARSAGFDGRRIGFGPAHRGRLV